MFLSKLKFGWGVRSGQWAHGWFLILLQPEEQFHVGQGPREPPHTTLRATIRYVKLHQFGHFMMGHIYTSAPGSDKPRRVPLSGTYGGDGLPRSVARCSDLYQNAVPVPRELYDSWNGGGGWNGGGSEMDAFRAWALENEPQLVTASRRKQLERRVTAKSLNKDSPMWQWDVKWKRRRAYYLSHGVSSGAALKASCLQADEVIEEIIKEEKTNE